MYPGPDKHFLLGVGVQKFGRIHAALYGDGMYAREEDVVGVLDDLARERYVKLGRTCMLVIQCCIQWLRN